MQFRIHNHNTVTDDVRLLIERKSRLIQRRLIHVRDDLKALDVAFARRRRDGAHVAKLVLTIPDRILAVRGDGPTLPSALDAAFDALGDRLDENLAKMGRVPLIRRQQLAYRRPSEQPNREEAAIEEMEEADEIGIEWEELATVAACADIVGKVGTRLSLARARRSARCGWWPGGCRPTSRRAAAG